MTTVKIRIFSKPTCSNWLQEHHGHTFDAIFNDDSNVYRIVGGTQNGTNVPGRFVRELHFNAMQIHVSTQEVSADIQKMLFAKGGMWASYGSRGQEVQHTDSCYLLVDDYGRIRHSAKPVNDLPLFMPVAKVTYDLEPAIEAFNMVYAESEFKEAIEMIRANKDNK